MKKTILICIVAVFILIATLPTVAALKPRDSCTIEFTVVGPYLTQLAGYTVMFDGGYNYISSAAEPLYFAVNVDNSWMHWISVMDANGMVTGVGFTCLEPSRIQLAAYVR